MDLVNEFVVPLPVKKAWTLLTDVEQIAPCMPGAKLEGYDGEVFKGTIQIKIGPVTPVFKGTAKFTERNATKYRAVLEVEGRDTRGQGFAKGTIIASVKAEGRNSSRVTIETTLNITGRMASFGRDVVGDISNKLFKQFLACLEKDLLGG